MSFCFTTFKLFRECDLIDSPAVDLPLKRHGRRNWRCDDGKVSRAPRHVEAPLHRRGQLTHDLLFRRGGVGVPAKDAVVLAAGEEQVGVLLAPGHGKDAPLENLSKNKLKIQKCICIILPLTQSDSWATFLKLGQAYLVSLEGLDGRRGQPEVPHLDHRGVVVLRSKAELRRHVRVQRNHLGPHPRGRVADLDDGFVLAQVPDDAARREGSRENVLHLSVGEIYEWS